MSVEVMAWVLNHSPTTGTDKIVLLGIANHADEHGGNAWPSVATLARYAGVSERSCQYALRRLVEQGHIVVHRQAGGTRSTAPDRRPNLYEVVLSGVQPASPRGGSGVQPASQRGATSFVRGVQPVAPEPSLNRPEPSAGSACPACGQLGEPHPSNSRLFVCSSLDCGQAWETAA